MIFSCFCFVGNGIQACFINNAYCVGIGVGTIACHSGNGVVFRCIVDGSFFSECSCRSIIDGRLLNFIRSLFSDKAGVKIFI